MRIEPAFLKSKVARRVFALFILSAVVPVIVMVLLALGQLNGLLEQIGYRELGTTTKSYGMSVVERLRTLEGALGALATDVRGQERSLALPVSAQLHFRSVRRMRAAELGTLTTEARARLAAGGTVVAVVPGGATDDRLTMLRSVDSKRPGSGTLVAEPDPTFLFGERDSLPYLTDVCVLGPRGRALFCSRPLPDAVLANISDQPNGNPRASWRENGEEFVASGWTLFLEGRYASPSWTVIVSRPKADLFAPLERFWAVVIPGLLVSLLFVMLLTVIQVRRQLVPLESLIAATRRIGNQDFTQPVTVHTGDEFEELAHALNAMAGRLGRQFSALATWSEADRAILSDPNIDHMLETVLKRLPDVVPADVLSVTVLEDRALGLGRTYARAAAAGARILVERTELSIGDINTLLARADSGSGIVCSDGIPPYLAAVARLGATSTCLLPVILKGTLVAVVGIGYRGVPVLAGDDRVHIGNVADRVAVAVLAAERERQLYQQAHYDLLTGLPNRLYVEDRLAQDIAHAQRDHQRLALLFIDLDRFKDVNDTLGHASGDDLLRQVAVRLQGCVRASDTVARLGGDEFTIVLTNIGSPRGAQMVAENVIRVLSEPIALEGRDTFVSCSIGVTVYPDDGGNSEELLRKADTAMYRAKQTGRGRYVFFEERMNIEALDRVALEQDLRRALARDEFVLHFQPQVNLRSGAVVGAEMLVRWAHPSRGLLAPDQFISIAENAGLIESIGEHLLRKACAQHSRWRGEGLALKRLAVNVSTRQLRQANFWELVQTVLVAADMPASSLELEITENLLLEDAPEVVANMARLEGMGVKVAIDDFGTGYSSLAYLKRLPIHVVKIDRVFMRDAPGSDDAATIVKTIVAMAQSLRKEVIAEGVESNEQISFLLAIGCHHGQGFAISPPLLAEEFAAYLRAKHELHCAQVR